MSTEQQINELRDALRAAVAEIDNHNREYKHVTPQHVIEDWIRLGSETTLPAPVVIDDRFECLRAAMLELFREAGRLEPPAGIQSCYGSQTMEPDTDPTPDEIRAEPLMQVFKHMHLRAELRVVSQPYCELARKLLKLPRNPERSVALRKLRESKDCAVTALLWVVPEPGAA
jgi:hypothetical protein